MHLLSGAHTILMNGIKVLFLMILLAATPAASGGDATLYFDAVTKDKYMLVVLKPAGKAELLRREVRPDRTTWFLHDDAATWGYFPDRAKSARPNIWVKTKQFRIDYFLDGDRLTELDKMGVQNVLTKRKNSNPQARQGR